MKRKLSLLLLLALPALVVQAQKYTSAKSSISFFSDAAIEDISAVNTKASSILNTATNEIVFAVPIREFQFEKSLMQEHFNEKYMESEKYPKSTFQGNITGFDPTREAVQQVQSSGKLSIHGVTRDVVIPGTIQKQGESFLLKTKFIVKLVDYKITIPQLLWQNIAEEVEVTIEFTYKPQ